MGLLSFMLSEEHSVASLHETAAVRKKFAKDSLDWNLKKNASGRFEKIFADHLVRLGIKEGPKEPIKKKQEEKKEDPKKREVKAEEKKKEPAKKIAAPKVVAGKAGKAAPAKP